MEKKSRRKNLSVTMPDRLVKRVKRMAREQGISVSAMVTGWIHELDRAAHSGLEVDAAPRMSRQEVGPTDGCACRKPSTRANRGKR